VVASAATAERELGFRAEVSPDAGLAGFRSEPLRA
jgi:hypothetical protein